MRVAGCKAEAPSSARDILDHAQKRERKGAFYPDNVLDAIYRHPCPAEPQGYYSRTPYGTVDVLPVEAENDVLNTYSAMAFLGWNTADEGQMERLERYVRQGGTLVLGWPHLFTDTRREDVFSGNVHPIDAHALTGVKLCHFQETNAAPTMALVELEKDVEVLETFENQPLLLGRDLGKGRVYFVNAREYPADPAVRPVYERLLHMLGREEKARELERGFLESAGTVQTAAYDCSDGSRTIYAVNTDWWSPEDPKTAAVLHLDGETYPVEIERGRIDVFTLRDGIVAEVRDMQTEVLELNRRSIRIQGIAGGRVTIRRDGIRQEITLEHDGISLVEF